MLPEHLLRRRLSLAALALPLLPGCAGPLPVSLNSTSTPAARGLLQDSAAAHGLDALMRLDDLSVRYSGEWRALIGRLQPALVDPGFRDGSEERLLLREPVMAQASHGPSGRKQVWRRSATTASSGEVRVWYNGEEASDAERRAAAALVADGYSLFLLGPMLLVQRWAGQRQLTLELGGVETLHDRECDVLRVRASPGLGLAASDQLALFIDRQERLMRGVRFTLEGLASTAGAIAQVDLSEHRAAHGVHWPTRFAERLLRPVPLPVHDWTLDALDVSRGLTSADIDSATYSARAQVPATAWAPAAPVPG